MRYVLMLALLGAAVLARGESADEPIVAPPPPQIEGSGYLLMDSDTRKILAEKNGDASLPPASLTKIMTSYIAAREIASGRISLDSDVDQRARVAGTRVEDVHSPGHRRWRRRSWSIACRRPRAGPTRCRWSRS